MKLRDYQAAVNDALWNYFATKPAVVENVIQDRNPLACLPTGTGKSLNIGWFAMETVQRYPGCRVLMLTHVKELIEQNADKLLQIWPEAPLGIYAAGLKKKQIAPITYASIQTIKNVVDKLGKIDVILIDEAHLLSPSDDGAYKDVIRRLRAINPYLVVIGFTATPYRLGIGSLTNNGIFTDTAIDLTDLASFNRLVNEGWLAPLITKKRGNIAVDTSNIGLSNGEFKQAELQRAADDNALTNAIVLDILNNAYSIGRSSAIIFASGIEHAQHITECFAYYGIEVPTVHSKMASGQRDSILRDFKAGRYWGMVGNNIFTTGFDHPPIDFIACARPTTSTGLWVQMLGRGTRPYEGKSNCIAAGSLVLTDSGLKAIERVAITDKVWDGVTFVPHQGVICKGVQRVLHYAGLVATPNHEVFTPEGKLPFGTVAAQLQSICRTGAGRVPLQLSRGFIQRNLTVTRQDSCTDAVRSLQTTRKVAAPHEYPTRGRRLQKLWAAFGNSRMVTGSLQRSVSTLQQPERPTLFGLRWAWYKMLVRLNRGNGSLCADTLELQPRAAVRQSGERRSLRTGQPSMVNTFAEHAEPKESTAVVYDIVNAGPRHRFTVNGLLVSNCLVFDYAGNTERLGPINDPVIPRMKGAGGGGQAPVWACDACGAYNHARAAYCQECGFKHDMSGNVQDNASNLDVMVSETPIVEMFEVDRVYYYRHVKKADPNSPPLLRVRYACGMRSFDEWIALEATGPRRGMARRWWQQRFTDTIIPDTVDQALELTQQLKVPRRITVHTNLKFPQIQTAEF